MKLVKKEIIGVKPVYDIEVKDNHNFIANGIVVHNCHRVAAYTWQQVVTMFPSYRRWGLTATVERTDGLQGIFISHIGPVVYKLDSQGEVKPTILRVDLNYELDLRPFRGWNGDVHIAKLVTGICSIQRRNEFILKLLSQAVKKGRKIIVFSERVGHLEELNERFNEMMNPDYRGGLYIGKMKQEERDKVKDECHVLFATYQIAKEGLDIPELDTAFLASPVSNKITVQQGVGRITRVYEDKKPPVVIDIVDSGIDICMNMWYKRASIYKKLGYPIEYAQRG